MHTTGFLLATLPVVALMPARPIAPVLITIYVCIGTLQHANLRWTFGPVGRVRVSPALGIYVAERDIGVDGPIREHYLITPFDTDDESDLVTEVCWPVFHTTPAA